MTSFNYKVPGDVLENELNNAVPKTLWQKIFLHLRKLGYDVFAPGQKRDKCIKEYVVIKENGTHATVNNLSGYKLFDILIYYPLEQYPCMEFYIENIKHAMKDIDELRFTGNETPFIIDSDVDAYTSSIEYQQFKSLRK